MSICLAMIAKNEAPRIARALTSVKSLVNCWSVCDTGSTDDTREIVKECMKGIPGQLVDVAWHNFGYNRQHALSLAEDRADWVLMLDADEELIGTGPILADPNFNSYMIDIRHSDFVYQLRRLVKSRMGWRFEGRTHETLIGTNQGTETRLRSHYIRDYCDSSRRQSGKKFLDDIIILEEQLREEPTNARAQFYLAQSYRDIDHISEALKHYQYRVTMGGWPEEVYYSLYQIAKLTYRAEHSIWPAVDAYLQAWYYRPTRWEALADLCRELRTVKAWYLIDSLLRSLPMILPDSEDKLFITPSASRHVTEERALAAYYIGRRKEARSLFKLLLDVHNVAGADRIRTDQNLKLCED